MHVTSLRAITTLSALALGGHRLGRAPTTKPADPSSRDKPKAGQHDSATPSGKPAPASSSLR